MVGLESLSALDAAYAKKAAGAKMSVSSMNISLGLDEAIDLRALGLDCGYNVITTGGDTFDALFEHSERGEIGFTDERFHMGVICPSLTTGGKPSLTIRVVPMAMGSWSTLRQNDRKSYKREKNRLADFFIEKVEQYLVPDLRQHIIARDVATPATYARYSGSPSGAIYDMAPYPDNFGRTRLKMRTPVKGLFQPKFVHGVLGSLLAGLQVNDMMLGRRVMNGNARPKLRDR
jgi:phytoene dehydrogenase-like protein